MTNAHDDLYEYDQIGDYLIEAGGVSHLDELVIRQTYDGSDGQIIFRCDICQARDLLSRASKVADRYVCKAGMSDMRAAISRQYLRSFGSEISDESLDSIMEIIEDGL